MRLIKTNKTNKMSKTITALEKINDNIDMEIYLVEKELERVQQMLKNKNKK